MQKPKRSFSVLELATYWRFQGMCADFCRHAMLGVASADSVLPSALVFVDA